MKGFRQFLMRGNVVDLAVAVVIGTAFTAVVTAFVKDLLTPLIAAAGAQPNFGGLYFTVNGSKFLYGDFINAIVAFLLIALVVYYGVVAPYARLTRLDEKPAAAPATKTCPECLSEIPAGARRCAHCGQPQPG
jgi:large conductance mechanosensitive channel